MADDRLSDVDIGGEKYWIVLKKQGVNVWTDILCRCTGISGSCNICWSVEFLKEFIRRIVTFCVVNNMNKYQQCALQDVDLGLFHLPVALIYIFVRLSYVT